MNDTRLTLQQLCHQAAQQFEAVDIDAPRLSAEVLMAHALDIDRAQLLARLDQVPAPDQLARFQIDLERVLRDEPLAYVVGHREFYDLDLMTDRRALIPRPETECLIEFVLDRFRDHPAPVVADIGTGCGAIAVTLAKHLPNATLVATDLSAEAIDLARSNAQRHQLEHRIDFRVGNLLEPVTEQLDLLAANLPYIDDKDWPFLQKTIRGREPKMAFIGGPDGLDLIRALLRTAPRVLKPHSVIVLEIAAYQGDTITEIASQSFPAARIEVRQDYAGLDRLAVIEL